MDPPSASWSLVAARAGVSHGEHDIAAHSHVAGGLGLMGLEWRLGESLLSWNKVSAGPD